MKGSRAKHALIMAAGYGTRLEPLTLAVPKPMVAVANKPIMRHNLELLRKHGIREIAANIHYHPEQVMNYFSDGSDFGVDLAYSYEETLMGTAGGVRRMAVEIEKVDDTFVVLSSDALTDINLRRAIEFHKDKKAMATLALCPVKEVEHFGVVEVDKSGRILHFQEKPKAHQAKSDLVNTGIYIFEPEILDLIPKGKFYDFGKELFPLMIKKNLPMYGYHMVEYWSDVGSIASYIGANYDAMGGRVRLNISGKKTSSCVWIGKNCNIAPSVKFEGCVVVGDRVEIRDGAVVSDTVIGDMSVIGAKANILGSVIWSDSYISKNVTIEKSVIGNWCKIEDGAKIGANCVISNRCQVNTDAVVPPETLLKPREII